MTALALIAGAAGAQEATRPERLPDMPAVGPAVPLPEAPERQFDFWLGEWDVQNKHLGDAGWADSGKARASIQPVVDGGAVLEQWRGTVNGNALIGFSLRAWQPSIDKWVVWLNWHGGRPGGFFPMHAVRNGERMELFPADDPTRVRYSFSQAHAGSCQWDEARSADGGESWKTRWIMQFTRRDDPLPVDATNAPIVLPPASAEAFPETRKLDWLIGAWEGEGRVRLDGEWQTVATRARVTSMIDGFGLLQFVDSADGTKTLAALGHDTRMKSWVAVHASTAHPGIRYLMAQPSGREVTFTAAGNAADLRERWACPEEDACTFRRETSTDDGKSWDTVFEAALVRSPSTAAFIDIPRVRTPFEGVLTGGQLSEADLRWAARNGYRTVINTRAPGEEGELADEDAIVRALGMRYVQIPVAGGDDVSVENARRLAESLADEDALPAIVHCRSGNRVGALFALKAHALDGASAEEALAIGRSAGMTGIEPLVREKLGVDEPEKAED